MKRIVSIIVITLLLVTASLSAAAAENELSPGIGVIAAKTGMTKSGLKHTEVKFSKEDFTAAVGIEPSTVTSTSLPPVSDGTLYLSSSPVGLGQTVSASNLGLLRFDAAEGVSVSSFRFTTDRTYSLECVIKLTDVANRAPATSPEDTSVPTALIRTQRDVTCAGTLPGSDPDGDSLTFEITKYPEHGIMVLSDKSTGAFRYTPYEGETGVDSVSYRVFDEYGNYSGEAEFTIKTEKRVVDVDLTDMEEHWGYNAALYALADKSMSATRINGELFFSPDEPVTRETFLVTVMKSLGAPEIGERKTVFEDDGKIKRENTGYVDAAYRLGVVKGTQIDGKLFFRPDEEITRAEAAVILNRIVGAKGPEKASVTTDGAVPAWAARDVSSLSYNGIMNGKGVTEHVTRAQTAQMLYNVKNLYLY